MIPFGKKIYLQDVSFAEQVNPFAVYYV